MKQLSEKHSQIFERIVRDRGGRLFRVRFVVVQRGGRLRGRVVSCEQAQELDGFKIQDSRFKSQTCCLPAWKQLQVVKSEELKVSSFFPSPYFNKFTFLISNNIRAPSL
ncbi:MAG: hypothetical protein AAB699_01215 [Patescibacteria group bacterium]